MKIRYVLCKMYEYLYLVAGFIALGCLYAICIYKCFYTNNPVMALVLDP